jgi:uncharacterized membrane protein YeaQ/YmgE (transglycosylase-associated protein family)
MMETEVASTMGTIAALIVVCVVGLLIGAIAKLLMPGPDPGGWVVTLLLGIAGSHVGRFVFGFFHWDGVVSTLVGAILGAMLILWVYRLIRAARRRSSGSGPTP